MSRKRTSLEVAQHLGMNRTALIVYIARHPELRPAERLPDGDLFWSEEEVQRLVDFRESKRKQR